METLTIDRVGAHGDGVARGEDGPVFVPFTLPGERVNCAVKGSDGTAMSVLSHRLTGLSRYAGISRIAAAARLSIGRKLPILPGSGNW